MSKTVAHEMLVDRASGNSGLIIIRHEWRGGCESILISSISRRDALKKSKFEVDASAIEKKQ